MAKKATKAAGSPSKPEKKETTAAGRLDERKKKEKYAAYRIKRSYSYESHDAGGNFNGLTAKEWKGRILDEWSPGKLGAESACVIFHDKDKDDEGNPKPLHAHAVIHYKHKDRKRRGTVCNLAKCSRIEDCLPADNLVDAYRYLLHVTEKAINEGKHIYDEGEVAVLTADGISLDYRKAITRAKEAVDRKKETDAVSDLLHAVGIGEKTLDEVREAYVSDKDGIGFTLKQWYKDKSLYEAAEKEWFGRMHDWYKRHNRCLTGIYIEGDGESGKSNLAEKIALHYSDRRGYHRAAAAGRGTTYDPMGTYKGEKVSIFNEIEGGNFEVQQFTDIFDPTHAVTANSRYMDKPWFAEKFIFTNSTPLEDFIGTMMGGSDGSRFWSDTHMDNKVHQIRRRFALRIVFGKSTKEYHANDGGCYTETSECIKIYVRDTSVECFITNPNDWGKKHGWGEPFKLFATVYPDDFPKSLRDEVVLKVIDGAVREYYDRSGYSITPWTVEKPDLEATGDAGKAEAVGEGTAWIPEDGAEPDTDGTDGEGDSAEPLTTGMW